MRTIFTLFLMLSITGTVFSQSNSMSIGMNVGEISYYNETLLFTDVMKTASEMIPYDSEKRDWSISISKPIPTGPNGYPLELPYMVDGKAIGVKFLINNNYSGEYRVTWDGEGHIKWNIPHKQLDGKHYITLNGKGGNRWLSIQQSTAGNPLRNIQIIPVEYEGSPNVPLFNPDFIKGLQPFTTIRFMDLMVTNNSIAVQWDERITKDYYTQGSAAGTSIDYAIELANTLNSDAWFSIPHQATDEYIRKFAELVKAKLDPKLKVYLEYSNEVWNWKFSQAHYVLNNAPDAIDAHVSANLAKISAAGSGHPEKDAYMMARSFQIWNDVWDDERVRLVTVAAVQTAWPDNSRRILEYLFDVAGVGADALAITGYFGFSEELHNQWNAMNSDDVTPELILNTLYGRYKDTLSSSIKTHIGYAAQYNLDLIVYEGGQHMQPWKQRDWAYNHAVYDAQTHPKMYDMYMKVLQKYINARCTLFTAYSYVSERKSKYGSWGHLESVDQINSTDLKSIAPKYQALLDAGTLSVTIPSIDTTHPVDATPLLEKSIILLKSYIKGIAQW